MLAPSASAASPFRAMAKPSITVAASGAPPGTPTRMLGIEPPVWMTACMESSRTIPTCGSIPNSSGSSSNSPILPLKPGTAPNTMPMLSPTSRAPNKAGSMKIVTAEERMSEKFTQRLAPRRSRQSCR